MKLLLLVMATCFWGLGFVGTRWTFISYDPLWSQGLRYVFSGLIALVLLVLRKSLSFSRETVICGVILWLALQVQTIGIGLTTLAKSGFLSTFYAIITPLLGMVFFKESYRKTYWFLVGIALVGVAFLCGFDISRLNRGDLFIIASALLFSLHIIAVDRYGQYHDSLNFNFQQCIVIGVLGLISSLIVKGAPDLRPLYNPSALNFPSALWGFFILSILSSLIAFSIQIYAQKEIPANIVSLIFLLEAVFASLFGYIFFAETLDRNGLTGAALIIISVALIPKFARMTKAPPETVTT